MPEMTRSEPSRPATETGPPPDMMTPSPEQDSVPMLTGEPPADRSMKQFTCAGEDMR